MSDMQTIPKLETLPNEILIECFEYLNTMDIFNAFDYLNSRFNNLIRNISLHLDASDVQQSALVQFGIKMSLNPRMKEQIISLKLSDKKICNNSGVLFSFVTLNEFSHLQALILCDVDLHMDSRICSMLRSLTKLRYFRVDNFSLVDLELFALLPRSTLQILSVSRLPRKLTSIDPFQALVDVTISHGVIDTLCDLFECAPRLQYLHVKSIRGLSTTIVDQSQSFLNHAVHLKRLTIESFEDAFSDLERLLKRTPNLKVLIITSSYNSDIVDACRWRILIETSLPLLTIFKFRFRHKLRNDEKDIIDKLKEYHTDFSHLQHESFVEYVINKTGALVHTLPCISNEYEIMLHSKRYYHESTNNKKTFANMTNLVVCLKKEQDNAEYHFPNVKSLELELTDNDENQDGPFLKLKHIECLRTLINMENIIYFKIPFGCQWESPCVILQLLKGTSNLPSLEVHINTLVTMLSNDAVCKYLSEIIKKLNIIARVDGNILSSDEIVKVCQIFSNLEFFHCYVGSLDNLDTILHELSKLPHLKVFSYYTYSWRTAHCWTSGRKAELDLYSFTIECEYRG